MSIDRQRTQDHSENPQFNIQKNRAALIARRANSYYLCDDCEFGADGVEPGFCQKASAVYVSAKTVYDPAVRLICQNYLVGLHMSNDALIDWIVEKIRDFKGRYRDEADEIVPVPFYGSMLRDGTVFWLRDQVEGGAWASVEDVLDIRSESVPRWRIIATVIGIAETVQPICSN